VKPQQPYRKIEYWRAGERVPDDEGYVITAEVLAGIEDKLRQNRKALTRNGTDARDML